MNSASASAPEDDKLRLARPQGSDSASAREDDELRLARPQGSDSASAPEDDELRLARAQPRSRAADPGGFTSRPRTPSSNGHPFGSPEAQYSPRSNLDQVATPTDRIAGAFNARMA